MSIREIPIAVRAHTVIPKKDKPNFENNKKEDLRSPYGTRVMVFDTETTTDIYQNLLFGQVTLYEGTEQVYIDGLEKEAYLFYGENLLDKDMVILKEYAKERKAKLLSRNDFVEKVFFPEIIRLGTVCIGFNLPFDLSRLAIFTKTFKRGKHKKDIELKLTNSFYFPTLLISPIDNKKAFIKLRFPTRPGTRNKRWPFRQGRFVDLRTLTFALTNESHTLKSACKLYNVTNEKVEAEEHGKISFDYCYYNSRDVLATFELYCKVKAEFDRHPLLNKKNEPMPAGEAYSPAAIGKAYYRAMGIRPLSEIQPDFPPEVLGYAMVAYYGGRSECHFRVKPVKDYHTDVTSMYPSVFTLQNLWSWVIAESFEVIEDTKGIKTLIDLISLDKLFKKDTWTSIPALVQMKPDKDLLPVRAEYSQGKGFQIGLNYLSTDEPMWYTLADIIAAKILTGKTPQILKAIRIIPGKPQEALKEIRLRGDIPINPAKDNFFKKVIELRKEYKKKVKISGDEADSMQLFLKILANSTSYGVYIELNRNEESDETEVQIFGLNSFPFLDKQVEKPGNYYNPLIAVMITGAARLILAMMEKTTLDLGGNFAFCDTDSMSIIDLKNNKPDEIGRQVVERFKSLYPYEDPNGNASLLSAEDYNWKRKDWTKDTDKQNIVTGEYFPLFCYMVSAKRYVLYNLILDVKGNIKVVIRKKSDHGLGHLLSPLPKGNDSIWVNDIWLKIIYQEYGLPFTDPDWFNNPALAQLSVSKPNIFNILNREKNKPNWEQVKPFNFMLRAYPDDSVSLFGEGSLISEFYCRMYKAIGQNGCNNKGKCKYAGNCFANLHKTPITPYAKVEDIADIVALPWLDKNTKQPILIRVSKSKLGENNEIINNDPEKYLLSEQGPVITIKNYWDFVKDYHLHPESKYDGAFGDKCINSTKGLLQRTHIVASEIKHIGKETNTLQDTEEKEILPEEQLMDDMILTYEQEEKEKSKSKIDREQWQNLLPILKEKAKPRKEWAKKLGICLDSFKQLLAEKHNPSEETFQKILAACKEEKHKIPKPSQPIPRRFKEENRGHIFPLDSKINNLRIDREMVLVELGKYIFELYGTKYLDTKQAEVKEILRQWQKDLNLTVSEEKKKTAEGPLKVMGILLDEKDRNLVEIDLEDVVEQWKRRVKGRNYETLVVRTKDGKVYEVLKKHNRAVWALLNKLYISLV